MNKVKILYITTNSDLGGISKYLMEVLRYLPNNIEPYFLMATPGYFSEKLLKSGVSEKQIFFVPMTNNIFDLLLHIKSNFNALNIVNRLKPDIIHCNATTGAIVGAFCGAVTKTPTIYTVHGWPFTDGIKKWKQIFYKILEFIICSVYKKIICVAEYDRQIGIKTFPFYKNKMVTIHNRISDVDKKYLKTNFSEDKLKIFMVSRCCPQKDPYTLISAVNECNKEGMDVQLDFFGYGKDLDKVLKLIEECNCENIRFCGDVTNNESDKNGLDKFDVTPILPNYDIYALISNWEGLPTGIEEGMRAGLPIIVSDVGGNSECIKDNGYLIPRGDITTLKEKISYLYNHKELLSILGKNSRKYYEEEFMAEKMVQDILKEYK